MPLTLEQLLLISIALIVILLILTIVLLVRSSKQSDLSDKIRDEFDRMRAEQTENAKLLREELASSQKQSFDQFITSIQAFGKLLESNTGTLEKRVAELVSSNEKRIADLQKSVREELQQLRQAMEKQIESLSERNQLKLDQMREVVDEKLQSTLNKRLGESFKLVSERLEAVQKGLGEMQNLATGVGDLKRVLTNVKSRGTWGEYQLMDLIEQILTAGQFERNVKPIPGSSNIVECAVKLPGKAEEDTVWLPIDAKFPTEDYQRLVDASDAVDPVAVEVASKSLMKSIDNFAKDISSKYVSPPYTTDFAIMFLPTEGLYSEVIRHTHIVEQLQQKYRIIVAGPTTLTAILNSLRLGFRTLAIEKRSSEVWQVLSAVKMEFGKFAGVLDKVKKQLNTASKTIDETGTRTRVMERTLRTVEELPQLDTADLLGLDKIVNDEEDKED